MKIGCCEETNREEARVKIGCCEETSREEARVKIGCCEETSREEARVKIGCCEETSREEARVKIGSREETSREEARRKLGAVLVSRLLRIPRARVCISPAPLSSSPKLETTRSLEILLLLFFFVCVISFWLSLFPRFYYGRLITQ